MLRTEWKYVLIGLMILVGHFKYNLSLMYYVRQLAPRRRSTSGWIGSARRARRW
jgi:hypothetical protein